MTCFHISLLSDPDYLGEYFKFSVCRCPQERMASCPLGSILTSVMDDAEVRLKVMSDFIYMFNEGTHIIR